jgi:hypothetical protein
MQRNGVAPVFYFFFVSISELSFSGLLYLPTILAPYGIPDPVCRSSWIGVVFPCCKTQNILSVLSVIQTTISQSLAHNSDRPMRLVAADQPLTVIPAR